MRRLGFALLSLLFCATLAEAQVTKNPTRAEFTVSPDHASVTRYELGFFLPGAAAPVQVSDIGTGAPSGTTLDRPLPSYPIGVVYVAKVRAWAGSFESDWSAESNQFARGPLAPSALVVK